LIVKQLEKFSEASSRGEQLHRINIFILSAGSNERLNDPLTKAFADVFRSGSQRNTGRLLS